MSNEGGMFTKLNSVLSDGKGIKIITAIGIIGIALIFISSFFDNKPAKKENASGESYTTLEYCDILEAKLTDLISDIISSDDVTVLVTLESGTEYIYANEIKQGSDKIEDVKGEENRKTQQKDSEEKNYIIVETDNGGEVALLITELAPRVRGVAVVCKGGDRQDVADKITEVVLTVLDITTKRVAVTGRS